MDMPSPSRLMDSPGGRYGRGSWDGARSARPDQ